MYRRFNASNVKAVTEGCKLPVRMKNSEEWPKAEVISIRQVKLKVLMTSQILFKGTGHVP